MNDKLYEAMDWARIEALVYSEEDNPHDILGANVTENGILIQTFLPGAVSVTVKAAEGGLSVPMVEEDENGFFAAFLPGRKIPSYTIDAVFADGREESLLNPYDYDVQIPDKALKKFQAGLCYDLYQYLGAHPMELKGVKGVYFAVWAPNALRVSLVGDFNHWDGRRNPMRKLSDYGLFELFMPGMQAGELYKYEIKARNRMTFLKSDPCAFQQEKRPGNASLITDLSSYEWKDQEWLEKRSSSDSRELPMAIYQVDLGSWKMKQEEGEPYSYSELAPMLADYVLKMGYTHVELFPLMEFSDDASMGFRTTGYFSPTSRYGTPQEFMGFVDYLHRKNIGVILEWVPSHFPQDEGALIGFDGSCLYEHSDSRRSRFAPDGGLLFNFQSPHVRSFLIANALFWTKVYHADGLRLDDISRVLYLDYGKRPGEWVPNLYGGNENLDAVEFFRHLNSIYQEQAPGAVLIAEDGSDWPEVTGPVEENGLGFSYKWNKGWRNTVIEYIQLDPIFRGPHHNELISSMVYNYAENFLLSLSYEDMTESFGSMYSKVPGKRKKKLANLRALYGYMFLHPGKKLLAEGCDIAQKSSLGVHAGVDWDILEQEENRTFNSYMAALLSLYRSSPALWALDYDGEGFEWINNISANENMLVFLRKSEKEEEMLLAVVNFSFLAYEDHKIGVPFAGKYKEIFNSDAEAFGGEGHINPRVKLSREDECDEFPNSIRILVPPMGISVFSCTRVVKKETGNDKARKAAQEEKEARTRREKAEKSEEKRDQKENRNENRNESEKEAQKESLKATLARKVREEGDN